MSTLKQMMLNADREPGLYAFDAQQSAIMPASLDARRDMLIALQERLTIMQTKQRQLDHEIARTSEEIAKHKHAFSLEMQRLDIPAPLAELEAPYYDHQEDGTDQATE